MQSKKNNGVLHPSLWYFFKIFVKIGSMRGLLNYNFTKLVNEEGRGPVLRSNLVDVRRILDLV